MVIDRLRRASPIPRSGPARRHIASWIAVIQRVRTARNLQANPVARFKTARRRFQKEFPQMDFVCRVTLIVKQPAGTCDAHGKEFWHTVGPHAHELGSEICVRRRTSTKK